MNTNSQVAVPANSESGSLSLDTRNLNRAWGDSETFVIFDPQAGPILQSATPQCDEITPGIFLSWTAVQSATNYEIYRDNALIFTTVTNGTTFWNVAGLSAGQSYSYRVRARFGPVAGGFSNTVNATAPTCTTVPDCAPGLIADCNGICAPAGWIGDGYCDNGYYAYNGVPIYFNCPQFGNDGGDCNAPPPPIQNPPNHNVPETPPQCDPLPQPTPEQNKLILITHGWIPFPFTTSNGIQEMLDGLAATRAQIEAEVSASWRVTIYPWIDDAHTASPNNALSNAIARGNALGACLATQNWQHIHFFGHSAGSGLITAAAKQLESTDTTVHTTYSDAFGGVALIGVGAQAGDYGLYSDWSDHYFSRERAHLLCGDTGPTTELDLQHCHNVDVTLLDPEYNSVCLSNHSWPREFYKCTIPTSPNETCTSTVAMALGYGFPLSFEQWTGPGGFAEWKAARIGNQPNNPNAPVELGGSGGSGSGASWVMAADPPLNLDGTNRFPSDPDAVQVTASAFTMTTLPLGATQPVPAWINFQITTTTPINYVAFDLAFTGDPNAAGLLTMYVDGSKCGVIEEIYALDGLQAYRLPTPDVLPPGDHYLSFRLDYLNQLVSSVTIQNVATGFGGFVSNTPGDINGDYELDGLDIQPFVNAVLANSTDPVHLSVADFNGNASIDVGDIAGFVSALVEP